MVHRIEQNLEKRPANHSALTPLSFLKRSATVFPDKAAVIDEGEVTDYRSLYRRCMAMAAALRGLGVGAGDTVAVLCHNSREMLESHYSVPMAGAVLNTLNFRLDAATLRHILAHGEARVLIYDTEFEALAAESVRGLDAPPAMVAVERQGGPRRFKGAAQYEALIRAASGPGQAGSPSVQGGNGDGDAWLRPRDEWDAIALNYTSGTTGQPKGVVYHHRGAFLAAMSNALAFDMSRDTVYLWTLPMFHCNGWCYTWAVTAVGGTHVCLRKIEADAVHERIVAHGVTHMCGAPIVLNLLLNDFGKRGIRLPAPVQFALGGAAPPSAVIAHARETGFEITHLYGLTESYGPSMLCVRQPGWQDLPDDALAQKMARQGVGNFAIDDVRVADRDTGQAVPADGEALGEILLRGNTLMKGYLKDPAATDAALREGWFHTGDLAVVHPDGYVEIKDRAKDIIISGGENISSQEVEEVLYAHPDVLEAAVVACPDEKWGEVPCAFVRFRDEERRPGEAELIAWCRARMAAFKVPRKLVVGELPKTATGKIRKNVLRDRLKDGAGRGPQS